MKHLVCIIGIHWFRFDEKRKQVRCKWCDKRVRP